MKKPVHRPDPEAPLLQTRGLSVRVGDRTLLQGLNLTVRRGELWCVLGRNGVGKTLLLHTLAGGRAPAVGRVLLGGQPLADWPLDALACWRGLMPQQLHDAFSIPVLDAVLQGRHPHLSRWHWEGEADHALARAALAQVGLAGFEGRQLSQLSGGERQRVALATLLAQDPPLALLDEPLAHLDLAQQLRMLDLLASDVARQRRAVILSVHDLSLAQRVATHVLLLGAGPADAPQVLAGPAAEVLQAPILSAAFGHPLHRHEAEGRCWWLPV